MMTEGGFKMEHKKWMELIQELNAGQPSLLDLVQSQIDDYESEKALCSKVLNSASGSSN
jgi:hypothetical protein